MMMIVWPLLIYWLVLFVACFVLVEIGHDQLYDEVTPRAGLKVAAGSFVLAALLTALRAYGFPASFESMFTTNIGWTLLQGVVWFLVFMFVFQFHPWHAFGLGVVTMILVSGSGHDGRRECARKEKRRDERHPAVCADRAGAAVARLGPGRRARQRGRETKVSLRIETSDSGL